LATKILKKQGQRPRREPNAAEKWLAGHPNLGARPHETRGDLRLQNQNCFGGYAVGVVRPSISVLNIEFGRFFKFACLAFGIAFLATFVQAPPVEPEKSISMRTTIHRDRVSEGPTANPPFCDGGLQMAIPGLPE
jgi:hypothetical protein